MNAPYSGTNVGSHWKVCLKGAQWAGRFASFFAIAFFITALAFRGMGGEVAGWFATVTAWCMMFAIFLGVACLVSAAFDFVFRRRHNIAANRDIVPDDKPAA